MWNDLKEKDNELFQMISSEFWRQEEGLELIASENFASMSVQAVTGSCLTNKYAEGFPGKRYYGGCEFVDEAERLARNRAKELFGAEYANVQPHSGSQANMAVYFAFLEPGDKILSMDLAMGGHLTHGSPVNFSGKLYEISFYGVGKESGLIDYDALEKQANEFKPKMIVAGASAYSRRIDFERFGKIAKSVGAYLLVDMAHIAGLIAAGEHPSPFPHADFVTSTTHKTLRGPRGGIILSTKAHAKKLNSNIFPGIQGGPLMHVIAAKAAAFGEALRPEFKSYQKQVKANASALAKALVDKGVSIVSGGTDNHLFSVDLRSLNITGKEAEKRLEQASITVNKNMIPYDEETPFVTSGIRIGTPAVTTRGMKETEMGHIAEWIYRVLTDADCVDAVKKEIAEFSADYPIYPDLASTFPKSGE